MVLFTLWRVSGIKSRDLRTAVDNTTDIIILFEEIMLLSADENCFCFKVCVGIYTLAQQIFFC